MQVSSRISSVARWREELAGWSATAALSFGRSATRPIHARFRHDGSVSIVLHEVFRDAPPEVVEAVGAWLRSGRRARAACKRLDAWIRINVPPAGSNLPILPRGLHHDLEPIAAGLLVRELAGDFSEVSAPQVTWGRRARSRARRSLTLGKYIHESRLVALNPVLDRSCVPEWFVRFILFHELLHAALPPQRDSAGRLCHHHAEFLRRERAYPGYRAALAWQRKHVSELLVSARRGNASSPSR